MLDFNKLSETLEEMLKEDPNALEAKIKETLSPEQLKLFENVKENMTEMFSELMKKEGNNEPRSDT